MKPVGSIATLILLVAVSVPAIAGPSPGGSPSVPASARNCVPSRQAGATPGPASPAKPPPIRVCVSDSDTQLNLPWFLTDVLTAVDTRQSPGDLLHKMRQDF